jgi:hypothetical protein
VFILLDHFEEYFLYHPEENAFDAEFSNAVNSPDLQANFLISIREELLANIDRFKGGIPNLFSNYLRLRHLDFEAGYEAIVRPIEMYNYLVSEERQKVGIEPALVQEILRQTSVGEALILEGERRSGNGAENNGTRRRIETAYLQLVMSRLWAEAIELGYRTLTLETLKKLGGARIIVGTLIDSAMDELHSDERVVASQIFRYLVTPTGAKIAQTMDSLAEFSENPESSIRPVLDKLSNSRSRILIQVASPDDPTQAPRYEIAHDLMGLAILDWRSRHLNEEQWRDISILEQQRAYREARGRRRLNSLFIVISLLCILLFLAIAVIIKSR